MSIAAKMLDDSDQATYTYIRQTVIRSSGSDLGEQPLTADTY